MYPTRNSPVTATLGLDRLWRLSSETTGSGCDRLRNMNNIDSLKTTLQQQVAERADDIEETRRIPPDLAATLKSAQAFSLLLPETLGGPQMALPEYIRLIQRMGEADGSTAWAMNQGSVLSTFSHQLPLGVARSIWTHPTVTVANGPPMGSTAVPVEGGVSISGRWVFSSGITHADWLIAACTVHESSGKRGILAFVPKDQVTIDETWDVAGLAGTASYSFAAQDLFIESAYALSPHTITDAPLLYHFPTNLMFACGFASVALGVSRAAMNFAVERSAAKVKRFQNKTLSDDPVVQSELGQCLAEWQAIEAMLHSAVDETWARLDGQAQPQLSEQQRFRLRIAATHTIRRSRDITDRLYNLCSTDSIYRSNDIQRRFQDIHVISQHLQGRSENYQTVAQYLMGLPYDRGMIS